MSFEIGAAAKRRVIPEQPLRDAEVVSSGQERVSRRSRLQADLIKRRNATRQWATGPERAPSFGTPSAPIAATIRAVASL